jgi:hypothetical protein
MVSAKNDRKFLILFCTDWGIFTRSGYSKPQCDISVLLLIHLITLQSGFRLYMTGTIHDHKIQKIPARQSIFVKNLSQLGGSLSPSAASTPSQHTAQVSSRISHSMRLTAFHHFLHHSTVCPTLPSSLVCPKAARPTEDEAARSPTMARAPGTLMTPDPLLKSARLARGKFGVHAPTLGEIKLSLFRQMKLTFVSPGTIDTRIWRCSWVKRGV